MGTIDASIALNRFGLGARAQDDPPGQPKRWLTAQLDGYEPRPAAIAALADGGQAVAGIVEYREQAKLARLQAQPIAPAPMAPAPSPMTTGAAGPPPAADAVAALRKVMNDQARGYYLAAVGARAQVALQTPAPFVERLVWFWSNHFAISIDKGDVTGLAGALENEAIRPHVLGRFGDMLDAVERHPAMLLFLDQTVSVGPNSIVGLRGKGRAGLNENLGRETLELHTLGVGSGYGQADVTELARALTGRAVAGLDRGAPGPKDPPLGAPGAFVFVDRIHEPGARTILGKSYGQPGEAQARAVLDDLSVHPATAKHIATKLARHFVSDDPPPALVTRLQAAFLKSGGDLPSVYRALVGAPEAWAPTPVKFKTPWEWTISAMRALGQTTAQPAAVNGLLNQLGQPLWKSGSPAGYDDIAASWAGPDAIMRRVEAAERFAARSGGQVDARALAPRLFPGALTTASETALARAESPGQALALLLVTPEFLRR